MTIAIPDLGFGPFGGYRVLSRLATEWTREGHDVTFYVPASSPRPYHPTEAKIVWADDEGNSVPAPPHTVGQVRGSARKVRELASLRRGLHRYAQDADIAFASHSFVALAAMSSAIRAKTVFYSQLYEPSLYAEAAGKRRWGHELLCRSAYLAPIVHVVNSPIYLTYPLTRANEWVAPGLDPGHFFPDASARTPAGSPFRIGTIGRIEPGKGTRYAVDAFRALRDAGESVELHVAFGGLDDETLAEPGVHLIVPNSDAQLGDFYRSVDAIVAACTYQFGAPHYPVMEALACGVPVVTTGYLPADETNAWIVPPHDASAIAQSLRSIRDDTKAASLKVQHGLASIAPFSWHAVADKMMQIFVDAVSRPGLARRVWSPAASTSQVPRRVAASSIRSDDGG